MQTDEVHCERFGGIPVTIVSWLPRGKAHRVVHYIFPDFHKCGQIYTHFQSHTDPGLQEVFNPIAPGWSDVYDWAIEWPRDFNRISFHNEFCNAGHHPNVELVG